MKKSNNGFTLIELLAVIIILGILMIIAIPAVTSYINNSRKSAYVDTAKEIISGARNLVNEGKVEMYNTDVTYYIDSGCVKTENASKSPYGDFEPAYIVVIYNGQGYKYYWVSRDTTGQGVPLLEPIDKLDEDDIKSDIKGSDIKTDIPIGERTKTQIINASCEKVGVPGDADTSSAIPEEGSSGGNNTNGITSFATLPTNKTKKTDLEIGDSVFIGEEEFYVVNEPATEADDLVLLARYNLNVGSNAKGTATGRQDSDVKGWVPSGTKYGNVSFSSSRYWSSSVSSYPADVYDKDNAACRIATYVEAYKEYLVDELHAAIKEARLLTYSEAVALGCPSGGGTCSGTNTFVKETSYWLGFAGDPGNLWRVRSDGAFDYGVYSNGGFYGVRPVIVI